VRKRDLLGAAPLMAAALALGQVEPAHALDHPDQSAANKRKVATGFASWMSGTRTIGDLLADDIHWTIAGQSLISGTTVGKAALVNDVLKPFAARFAKSNEPFRPASIKGIYADGDTVAVHWDGRGVANDGELYLNSYAWFLTMREGLIAEATAFFDSIAFNELWNRIPAGR
jgi:ketosteroid isomerase-like protein